MAKGKEKKIKAVIKLAIQGGKATPAPPIGPALGQHGVPLMEFCKEFNTKTQDKQDDLIPVVLTVYEDRSFKFITKTPVTSALIRKALKLEKGSAVPNKDKVGKLKKAQIEEIANIKLPDLNTNNIEEAIKIVEGTARSMGVEYE